MRVTVYVTVSFFTLILLLCGVSIRVHLYSCKIDVHAVVSRDSKPGAFLPNPGFGFGKPPDTQVSGRVRIWEDGNCIQVKLRMKFAICDWYVLIIAVK